VVGDFDALVKSLAMNLENPAAYLARNKSKIAKTKKAAYDDTLDGKSCQRYLKELDEIL
jgi:hypothetical protein